MLLPALLIACAAQSPSQAVTIPSEQARIAAEFFDAGPGAPGILLFPMCAPQLASGASCSAPSRAAKDSSSTFL